MKSNLHYLDRNSLRRYDKFIAQRIGHLAHGYHWQLDQMRLEEKITPLVTFDDATTEAAQALHRALTAALSEQDGLTKQYLFEFRARLAEVRFEEEFFNPEGFYELMGPGEGDDNRAYDLATALAWFNNTELDPTDSYVLDEVVYPQIYLQYTYLEDDEMVMIGIAGRHARQASPRQLTKLPARVRGQIEALEAQQARALKFNPKS